MGVRWDIDPTRSLRTGYSYDPDSDALTILHEEDVEPVLKFNKQVFNWTDPFAARRSFWHLWAKIPSGVCMQWMVEKGVNILDPTHMPKVIQLLHDPDFLYLRQISGSYMEKPAQEFCRASTPGVVGRFGKSGKIGGVYGAK